MMKFYTLGCHRMVTSKTLLFSLLLTFTFFKANTQPGNALLYTGNGNNVINGLPNQQYLKLPAGIVQTVGGEFTVEAWVNWSSTAISAWQRIFDFGSGTGNFMFLTPSTNTNQARFAIVSGATVEILDAAIQMPTNAWTHIAVSVDNTNTGRIFFNGVLQGTSTFTLRPASLGNTPDNFLGKSQFLPDPYFNGVIDEFRISNIARYTGPFTPTASQFTVDANTVALFHFNEGSGQQTFDATSGIIGELGFSTAVEPDLDPTWFSGSILPVRMEYFTAQKQGNDVELKWKASSTGEGGTFVIERSLNGTSYENIGKVAINNNPGAFSYSFRDAAPEKGKNFYRLRIQENNADPKLSSVVWVDLNGKASYAINPNISSSEVFITIPSPTRLSIYNSSGVLVQRMQLQASQNINISALSGGLYHIQFEGTSETLKFIRQ